MQFTLNHDDVKAIMSKLTGLVLQEDSRPQFNYLQFDLDSTDMPDSVRITVSALYNYGGGALSVIGRDYDGPAHHTLCIPPFKIPAGTAKLCTYRGVIFTVSDDDKDISIDFNASKITLPLYQAEEDYRISWSKYIPKDDPVFTVYFDREILERALKAFDKGINPAVRIDFYSAVNPAVLSQPSDAMPTVAMACPIRIDNAQISRYSQIKSKF